jgi:4-hydroxythreonine-4-phosphate dehydrogenase
MQSEEVAHVALTVGDPAGIGPEITLAAMRDERVRARMCLSVVGPAELRPAALDERSVRWIASEVDGRWELGHVQRASGSAALSALRAGVELATSGSVDALVTGPVSKEALHLAGEAVEGQTELLARWAGVERCEMVAIAGKLRVMLATRHLPLAAAIASLRADELVWRLELFEHCLRTLGIAKPRLALAGLNPHAGERGLLGREEEIILEPALATLRARGLAVAGPLSPDSVFLRASRGEFDGVLALYHDQAFIPLKLLSGDEGFTFVAGLPYLRFSPVHGTAFDLAGRGIASAENLVHVLLTAAEWVAAGRTASSSGR